MSIEDKFFIHLFIKNIITENILSNISKIVKKFTDKVKENSDRIEKELIAKNKEKEYARRKKQLEILNCDFMINAC